MPRFPSRLAGTSWRVRVERSNLMTECTFCNKTREWARSGPGLPWSARPLLWPLTRSDLEVQAMTESGEEARIILRDLLDEQRKTNQLLHLLIQALAEGWRGS